MLEQARTRWLPTPGDQTPRRHADADGRAHQARARRRPRHRPRQAGASSPSCARPTSTRSTRAAGFMDFNTPDGGPRRRRPSSARRTRSATRSTGSTPTPSTSPTSTPAPTRCARKRIDHDFPVAREVRVARLEPGRLAAALHARFDAHPQAIDQNYLVQLEQQAGARLRAARTTNAVLLDLPLRAARGPREGARSRRRAS